MSQRRAISSGPLACFCSGDVAGQRPSWGATVRHPRALVALGTRTHPAGMIVVTEAAAAAIRAAFEQRGELSAAVELRRLFPGVTDTAQACACARTQPLPA